MTIILFYTSYFIAFESDVFYIFYCSVPNCSFAILSIQTLSHHKSKINHLDISSTRGSDDFVSELVRCSLSLQRLDLKNSRRDLVGMCFRKLPVQNMITTLNLGGMRSHSHYQVSNLLSFDIVKNIIDKCQQLTGYCL